MDAQERGEIIGLQPHCRPQAANFLAGQQQR
jgi:hypothetical protein